jgi:hypothetical protein
VAVVFVFLVSEGRGDCSDFELTKVEELATGLSGLSRGLGGVVAGLFATVSDLAVVLTDLEGSAETDLLAGVLLGGVFFAMRICSRADFKSLSKFLTDFARIPPPTASAEEGNEWRLTNWYP